MIRRALGLTPTEFSDRYRVPLTILADWEEGRTLPDEIAGAYLHLIASDPVAAARALAPVDLAAG
jgi:putative transcriptional regulator